MTIPYAHAANPLSSRPFWIGSSRIPSLPRRQISASIRASGARVVVYAETGTALSQAFLNRIVKRLEEKGLPDAYAPKMGLLPFEESVFGPVPPNPGLPLLLLFAHLGPIDAYFDPRDLLSPDESSRRFALPSNHASLLYINAQPGPGIEGAIARELSRLLGSSTPREGWLDETLAEGAMILSGTFGASGPLHAFANNPGTSPLVSPEALDNGSPRLFASYLLDTLPQPPETSLGVLAHFPLSGREAVESAVRALTEAPLSFDAIFSNFISYVFGQAGTGTSLPSAWKHRPGLELPEIVPQGIYRAGSLGLTGELAPYSFVAVRLEKPLSPNALIQVQRDSPDSSLGDCSTQASLLWKPIHPDLLAIYAVGCDPKSSGEKVAYRLRILDQPSLLPPFPFKIQP